MSRWVRVAVGQVRRRSTDIPPSGG